MEVTAALQGTYSTTSGAVTSTNAGTGNTALATLFVTALPTCQFTSLTKFYDNPSNTIVWTIQSTIPGSDPVVDRIVVFWSGSDLMEIKLDGYQNPNWFPGGVPIAPTGSDFTFEDRVKTLGYGTHSVTFTFINNVIKHTNFNATLYFYSGCRVPFPVPTTGSWYVQ